MDTNCNSSSSRSNQTCGVDMTMEGLILHDQLPYDLVCPNYPLQTHLVMPTSSHVMNPAFSSVNQQGNSSQREQRQEGEPEEELGAMKEMMYKIAAMQPVDIDPASIQKPKRRNVRISSDPQSVAARHRRERISEKIRILQRLVPGGTKMDTATMLDEAIRYVKFLKRQVHELQSNEQSMPMPFPPHNIGGIIGNLSAMDYEALGITSPFSSSVQPAAIAAAGFTIEAIGSSGGGRDNPCGTFCFNHQDDQVIRINDSSD